MVGLVPINENIGEAFRSQPSRVASSMPKRASMSEKVASSWLAIISILLVLAFQLWNQNQKFEKLQTAIVPKLFECCSFLGPHQTQCHSVCLLLT